MLQREENGDEEAAAEQGHTEEPFLFDSVTARFNVARFVRQLLIHLLWPIGPLLSPNPASQRFLSLNPVYLFFNHVASAMAVVMVVLYILLQVNDGSVWYPLLFYLLHKVTVASKYASLSSSEYNRIMSDEHAADWKQYHSQLQLASAWVGPRSERSIEHFLIESALKTGVNIDILDFVLDSPADSGFAALQYDNWKSYLETEKYLRPDPSNSKSYRLSVFQVCKKVIQRTDITYNDSSGYNKVALFFAMVLSTIPFFKQFGTSSLGTAYGTLAMLVTFVFFYLVAVFMSCALLGLQRLAGFQTALGLFIRLSDVPTGTSVVILREGPEEVAAGDKAAKTLDRIRAAIRQSSSRAEPGGAASARQGGLATEDTVGDEGGVAMSPLAPTAADMAAPVEPSAGSTKKPKRRSSVIADAVGDLLAEDMVIPNDQSAAGLLAREPSARSSLVGSELRVGESIPRLSFRHEENLVAWCYARLVLLNFGERFTKRLELVTWSCALANFVMVLAVMSMLFGARDATARYKVYSTPLFRQSITSVLVFSLFLISYTYMGANINRELNSQRTVLSAHLMRVRERIIERKQLGGSGRGSDLLLEHWENVGRAVSSALQTVGAGNDHQPFSVLGFPASYALPKTIGSLTLSFLLTLGTVFYTSYYDESSS